MTAIPGTNVAAPIVPFDTQDTYPAHDALYGKGGWRSVATIAERDAIPAPRRTKGMIVRVTDDPVAENNAEWEWNGTAFVVTPLRQRVDDLEGRTTVAEGDINALESRAAALEGQATTAAVDIDALEGRATALEGRATTAEGDINALEGRATAAEADIAALEGMATEAGADISALEGRATALESHAVAVDAEISALEGRTTAAEGDIDTLQSDLQSESEVRAVADSTVLDEAKRYTDATGVKQLDGMELAQKSGHFYGRAVWSLLGRLQGLAPLLVNDRGEVAIPKLLAGEQVISPERGPQYNYSWAIADRNGNVLCGVLKGKWVWPDAEFLAKVRVELGSTVRELEEYAAAIQVGEQANDDFAVMTWDFNHIIGNGQSLGWGSEAWPSLSKVARLGNLMLGNSVRPVSEIAAAFTPVGTTSFQPMVATVRNQSTGGLLNDSEVAALAPGSQNAGETPIEALVNGLKRGFNDRLIVANDPRALVASVCNVPGRTIEQLSKGADPNIYNRYLACLTAAKGIADGQSKTYGVAVIALLQGEYNYRPDWGGTTNEEAYLALWLQWIDDHAADAIAITGQAREPLFLTYQTSGAWTRDTDSLSIGMAQWRATKERKNLFLAAPAYPVTDKNGHLDSNGSRWLGYQFAKAAIWSSVHRRRWRPLEPVQIRQEGNAIYIAYYVPCPPLRFADIYVSGTAHMYAAKGFRVQDDSGFMVISNVEIVSAHVVKITLSAEPTGTAYVWYADYTVHAGNGNLTDSDHTLADDLYEYLPDSGMYASANIPALVDKPYPLANFSVAFRLPAGFSE